MQTFTRDGWRFDVRDPNPAGAPTVVLLHGFPQDGTAYDAVVPLLTRAGLRTLVPDQRGYSPGARPGGRRPYVLRELVDDVVALLDQAEVDRAHVVGHDWGGTVAWAFASRRAERTLSLTALSTPHPAALVGALRHGQARRSSYMLGFQVPWLPEHRHLADDGARLVRKLTASGLTEERARHYAARLSAPGALTAALAWYRAIPLGRGFSAGRVHVPTTHVFGRADPYFSAHAQQHTAELVKAPLRTVPLDAGHWLPESHPVEVAAEVLAQVRATA